MSIPLTNLVWTVAVAACYFYQNVQMFQLMNLLSSRNLPVWKWKWLTFGTTYLVFMILSAMSFPLSFNWCVVAVILVLQIRSLYRTDWQGSISCGLIGAIVGLGMNTITRSLVALVLNVPFSLLDARAQGPEYANLKRYPIMAGFLLAGFLFWILRRRIHKKQVFPVEREYGSGKFVLCLLIALYGYLCLNLLIYFTSSNDWVIKLWGLKSGVFALAGLLIGLHYMAQANRLRQFEKKRMQARQALDNQKVSEQILEQQAYTDFLTDCYSRQFGMETLKKLCETGKAFRLCFVDADGLKRVNDRYGHETGDQYLCAVSDALKTMLRDSADILCRYGGDEFLAILPACSETEFGVRRARAEKQLEDRSALSGLEYPFRMSFGMVSSEEGKDPETLIQLADQKMYQEKQLKR